MSLQAVIDLAMADLGYTEYPPDSNMTKYGEAYGMNGVPWCVESQWYWFNKAGEGAAFFGGGKTASCGTLLRWYREQGQTVAVSEVQTGDIVILNFSGTRDTEHCGLALGVNSTNDNYINTIEGNTTPGEEKTKQANGGCVALKHRHRSQIVAVCRPKYKPEAPKKDYEGHWYEKDIQWGIDHGILTGYPDGTYKPEQPITRAEAIALLRRYHEMGDDGK